MDTCTLRRAFLKRSLMLAALAANGLPLGTVRAAQGDVALSERVLVNVMLNGGPDMRHLMMPPWSAVTGSYGHQFWRLRANVQASADTAEALEARWHDAYLPVSDGALEFGILREAGWLHTMWNAGKLAVVCGVESSPSRDHDLAVRTREMGNRHAHKDTLGSGWGGRLAFAAGGNAVALTKSPRRFAFGPDPALPTDLARVDNRRLVAAGNMREMALAAPAQNSDFRSTSDRLKRALENYYGARRDSVGARSVYAQYFDNERMLRELGGAIDARLADVPVPAAFEPLFGDRRGTRYNLALQTRNLYDALVCSDLLALRVASMEYNVWDTHSNQAANFAAHASLLFGATGALATLWSELPDAARARLVFVIGGEFGRQLAANGGGGTEHGEGTSMLVIGDSVAGGVYGTMFPDEEIARFRQASADIVGVNAIDHVFGRIAEWIAPGSKPLVFPDFANAPLESGLSLDGLLLG
ncbi:MAG: DUF1501 domain-containing protein [Gammaproteobacteria bacterium]|nr:DUF1501 domain-containing protein [Gammaproteobacteria bacterium]